MDEQNFYELLGVTQDASKDEIKRAYYKKIRIYTNEKYPDKFQELNKAYETLSNEQKRADYDRESQDGGVYATLKNRVIQEYNKENFHLASVLLEEMLTNYPDDPELIYMLGDCYVALSRYQDARKIVAPLVIDNPNVESYRILLYYIYNGLNDKKNGKFQAEKLIELNPLERNYYLFLSNIHVHNESFEEAAKVLEKGITSGPVDVADYPLLSELYFVTWLIGDERYRKEVMRRIKQLPRNEQEREQVLSLLIKECEEVDQNHEALPDLVRLVREINGGRHQEVLDWLDGVSHLLDAPQRSSYRSQGDYQQNQTHRETGAAVAPEYYGEDLRGSLFVAIIIGIIASFAFTPIGGIIAGFIYYFYGVRIKQILGCLITIIIVFGIIALIASGL